MEKIINILVNDGIHADGKLLLEEAAYVVNENKVPQDELVSKIHEYDVLIVRSATKVTREVIEAGKNLKIIARGGVGLDNIDLDAAKERGIAVFNTPNASSRAVAELAFGHLFTLSRSLHRSNREMGTGDFKKLKKAFETGFQLRGRTLGIVGFGRIGQEVAKMALGLGMRVLPYDPFISEAEIGLQVYGNEDIKLCVKVKSIPFEKLLRESDFITLHVPGGNTSMISKAEIAKMKDGVVLINTARGGTINEADLLEALESGKIAGVGLDVFANEPNPNEALLKHPNISVTPHIGASTLEAQSYIGMELADKIIVHFGDDK